MRLASIIKLIEAEPHVRLIKKWALSRSTSFRCNIGRDRELDWKPQYSVMSGEYQDWINQQYEK